MYESLVAEKKKSLLNFNGASLIEAIYLKVKGLCVDVFTQHATKMNYLDDFSFIRQPVQARCFSLRLKAVFSLQRMAET